MQLELWSAWLHSSARIGWLEAKEVRSDDVLRGDLFCDQLICCFCAGLPSLTPTRCRKAPSVVSRNKIEVGKKINAEEEEEKKSAI